MLKIESGNEVVTDRQTLYADFWTDGITLYPTLFKWRGIKLQHMLLLYSLKSFEIFNLYLKSYKLPYASTADLRQSCHSKKYVTTIKH